jgi:hypothetical protein
MTIPPPLDGHLAGKKYSDFDKKFNEENTILLFVCVLTLKEGGRQELRRNGQKEESSGSG